MQCPKCLNAHEITSEEKYEYGFLWLTKELYCTVNKCNSCGFAWSVIPGSGGPLREGKEKGQSGSILHMKGYPNTLQPPPPEPPTPKNQKNINTNMKVKIINKSNNEIPSYATEGSAAVDLISNIQTTIAVGERKAITTGIYLEFPQGYFAMITPRSGMALKNGISIVNSPGIADADYRGEYKVILINHGNEDFNINVGDRIAQMAIMSYTKVEFTLVNELSETERGEGGFGHTGHA